MAVTPGVVHSDVVPKSKTLKILPSGHRIELVLFSRLQNYRPHASEPE
jgi:hypothetical protein